VRSGTDGGTGLKPSDLWTVSLAVNITPSSTVSERLSSSYAMESICGRLPWNLPDGRRTGVPEAKLAAGPRAHVLRCRNSREVPTIQTVDAAAEGFE
jgi:hypothetical protein